MKKSISILLAGICIVGCFASCSGKDNSSSAVSRYTAPGNSKKAEAGEAYLAISDSDWYVQYWGKNDDPDASMLSYGAGIAPIKGNGDYTVSVTADTDEFRELTKRADSTAYGLEFLAVMIPEGETLFPDAVITVKEVRVDGNAVPLSAKAYTSSDDGIETRANIFNQWIDKPSLDARCIDGALYTIDEKPVAICGEYSPHIVSADDFEKWTTIEVDFTISGIAE